MTVQAGTALDLDLELMVGEMPTMPCEHSQHHARSDVHGEGPATHYVIGRCDCSEPTIVYAICQRFVEYIRSDQKRSCPSCGFVQRTTERFQIIGPIGSATK